LVKHKHMNYEVPQFIREDVKLMGWITFTQLWIALSFGGLIILLFFILELWLWMILSMFLAPIGILLAFGQIHSVPIYSLIIAAIRHFWLPKYYLWKKETATIESSKSYTKEPEIIIKTSTKNRLDKKTLKQLTEILDR